MNRASKTLRIACVFVGASCLVAALGAASLQAGYLLTHANPAFWTDPCADDYPMFVGLLIGPVVVLGFVLVVLGRRAFTRSAMLMRLASISAAAFVALLVLGAMIPVVPRHRAAWAQARAEIFRLRSFAAGFATNDDVIASADWQRLRPLIEAEARAIAIDGWPHVSVRLSTTVDPYVALDLGDGKTMQIEPTTMRCIYSD